MSKLRAVADGEKPPTRREPLPARGYLGRPHDPFAPPDEMVNDANDARELRVENERLRSALEQIVNMPEPDARLLSYRVLAKMRHIARQALSG